MIELKKNKAINQYRFTLKADNGKVLFESESYDNKSSALDGINVLKNNAINNAKYERNTNKKGKFYFNLKSANNQTIGCSQMYSSESGMENGIKYIKEHSANAIIKEL